MTVTLITGANRGLGRETARRLIEVGHTVYIGSRDVERGEEAASQLGGRFVQLDVTDDASVETAVGVIGEREGHLDVLINNAGVSTATSDVSGPIALQVFDTNAIGVIRVTQAALPLLRKSENPVVVNVSSALGSFWAVTNPERRQFHYPSIVYGASKAAVSMLTVQYAKALPEIKFNAVEPGFTATDLTPVSGAGQPVEKGAEVIVRLATIGTDGPTGTFEENDGELAW
jgi:NAD(P)-dependent dehydrogenase (short-subunit alcohol dehydrogenase family)